MIRINQAYLDKFKKTKTEYVYPISKGIFLAFDKELNYIGVEMMYTPYKAIMIDQEAQKLINRLIALGILESTL